MAFLVITNGTGRLPAVTFVEQQDTALELYKSFDGDAIIVEGRLVKIDKHESIAIDSKPDDTFLRVIEQDIDHRVHRDWTPPLKRAVTPDDEGARSEPRRWMPPFARPTVHSSDVAGITSTGSGEPSSSEIPNGTSHAPSGGAGEGSDEGGTGEDSRGGPVNDGES